MVFSAHHQFSRKDNGKSIGHTYKDAIEMDNDLQGIDARGLDAENWQTITENGSDPLDNDNVDGWVDKITPLAHN